MFQVEQSFKGIHGHVVDIEMLQVQADEAAEVAKSNMETYIQFSSVAQSCPTLCHPMNHSTPGPPVQYLLSHQGSPILGTFFG